MRILNPNLFMAYNRSEYESQFRELYDTKEKRIYLIIS